MEFVFSRTIHKPYEALKRPLMSGQHFRTDLDEDELVFVCGDGFYRMFGQGHDTCIEGTKAMDVADFFDLERDYDAIEQQLSKLDNHMKAAVDHYSGLRILKQDPFEMVMTFIVSQSKQIPQIKVLIERLSQMYGTCIGTYRNKTYYSFPAPQALAFVDEGIYRALKFGYRGAYLADAVEKILTKVVDLNAIGNMTYEDGMAMLMQIKGVGEKVADCVMLYGYGNFSAFPVDVWIERVVSELYFKEKPTKDQIRSFVRTHFGPNEGIAQQYLFEYGRNQLGKGKF